MKRHLLYIALLATVGARAQDMTIGGQAFGHDRMTPADIYALSQQTTQYGTARSMALQGTIVSLGADLTSMAVNPAGLGMYRRSEISLTPLVPIQGATSTMTGPGVQLKDFGRNARTRFALGNIGIAGNVYTGTGALAGVTLGFAYNRAADYNYRYALGSSGNLNSIGDAYAADLQWAGLGASDLVDDSFQMRWHDVQPDLWGAMAGYDTGLVSSTTDGWRATWISQQNVDIHNKMQVQSTGNLGEYDLSAGFNISNKLYLGATLGIYSLNQRLDYTYSEDYFYDDGTSTDAHDPALDYQLLDSRITQSVRLSGVGTNFKVGAVYRPVEALRIGLAYHTPTAMSVDRYYQVSASTHAWVNTNNPEQFPDYMIDRNNVLSLDTRSDTFEDAGQYDWNYTMPGRLLAGVSYTFGQRGLIALDYERTWYNHMRMRSTPEENQLPRAPYNQTFKDWFRPANTLRLAGEWKPSAAVALRAGVGYRTSPLKDNRTGAQPMETEQYTYSLGVGFMLGGGCSIDLAYSLTDARATPHQLYYVFSDTYGLDYGSSTYRLRQRRHAAAMTFSVRF